MRKWHVWATILKISQDDWGGRERQTWTFDDEDDAERFLALIRLDSRVIAAGMY